MTEITAATVLMMIVVCGLVWGGFAALLTRAVRREKAKLRAGERGINDRGDAG